MKCHHLRRQRSIDNKVKKQGETQSLTVEQVEDTEWDKFTSC